VLDINKPIAETNAKEHAVHSSGEPTAANAGFHNRPATRAGPYEKYSFFIRIFQLLLFIFKVQEIY
jgi:hypothetical protein